MGTVQDKPAFQITYPVYLIHVGEGDDIELWGDTIQDHDFIVAFTDLDQAERFVAATGSGSPLPINNLETFRQFLRHGGPTVVSFDPSIRGKQMDFKNQVFVKDILANG